MCIRDRSQNACTLIWAVSHFNQEIPEYVKKWKPLKPDGKCTHHLLPSCKGLYWMRNNHVSETNYSTWYRMEVRTCETCLKKPKFPDCSHIDRIQSNKYY